MDDIDLAQVQYCVCGNLRKATRVVTQEFDTVLEPSGLTITQFSLLSNLAKHGPATISQLAERVVMDATTLTRNLKPLMREHLVTSVPGGDQRTRNVSLTDQGREKLAAAMPLWESVQSRLVERLGRSRLDAFLKDLYQVAQLIR